MSSSHSKSAPVSHPWWSTTAVMMATFMVMLDYSVANVALPHIAGNLSAGTDEATWVLTSYLAASAIILPTANWLGRLMGRKRYVLFCVILFTVSSLLCGIATSLPMLVVARVLQGLGGGAFQPTSQAILLENFPHEKRGMAMGIFSLGMIVAPIVGPTLGGWITDNFSWRWIFLINIPVGFLSYFMINAFVHDPSYLKRRTTEAIDYSGLLFMVVWLTSFQIMLDKGQQKDWFADKGICAALVLSFAAMLAFIYRELTAKHPFVDLRVLKDRNFAVGVVLGATTAAVLFGSTMLLPLYLQLLMGYTALLAGITLSPRGIGSFFASVFAGKLTGKFDERWLMIFGFAVLGIANVMLSRINLEASMKSIIIPAVINGIAIPFIFVPLTTITVAAISNEKMGNATGVLNLIRNLGGSIGISIIVTLMVRGAQVHQNHLVEHLSPLNASYAVRVQMLEKTLTPMLGVFQAKSAALGLIYKQLMQQSQLMTYMDSFRRLAYLSFASIPLVFLFKRPNQTPSGERGKGECEDVVTSR